LLLCPISAPIFALKKTSGIIKKVTELIKLKNTEIIVIVKEGLQAGKNK